MSGHKFNISSGLKQRSRHVSGAVEAAGVGSALRGLDTALEKIALQQQQESQQYVAKVTNQNTAPGHVTQCSPLIGCQGCGTSCSSWRGTPPRTSSSPHSHGSRL